jgi:putative sigma-54 modulation protein
MAIKGVKVMKVIITSKNFNASDHLKATIEKKFERLGKYFSDDIVANVTLVMEKGRQTMETTINAKGTIFRAEETSNDMYVAIDSIIDKLASQMSRFKTKLQRKHKEHKELEFGDLPDDSDIENEAMTVARSKKFDMMPMTSEEAIMQMELLGHTFFVFMNVDTSSVGVVYKRKNGDFGLLEPKY